VFAISTPVLLQGPNPVSGETPRPTGSCVKIGDDLILT